MPKLTPNKLIKLRRELIPLVGDVNASKALDWCKAKYDELKGLVDIDTIVDLFKMQGIVPFLVREEEAQKVSDEEIKKREAIIKPMTSNEYLIAKKNKKSNKIQTKLIKEDYKNMKDFWDRQEDMSDFLPFLKIKNAVTYTLELIDADADPRQGVDGFGNNQYIFDVVLRNISPKKALEDVNKEGFALYVIDKSYAFTVKTPGRSKDRFHALYDNAGPIKTFSFKRTGTSFQTDYVYKKVN